MVRNMRPVLPPNHPGRGARENIHAADLNAATADAQTWVSLYETQSDKSLKYFPGYGAPNREGNAGFADLDLKDDTAAPGVNIDGDLRWEVYRDSNRDELVAVSDTFRTEELRAAVASNRTEKVMIPVLKPGAPEDGYVVLALKADSSGQTVGTGNSDSDLGMPYTRLHART